MNDRTLLHLTVRSDLLDDFSGPKPAPTLGDKSPTVTNHDNEQASKTATSDRAAEEFSKQLQEQMAALMSEAEESPEMQRELEAMVEELGEAVAKGEDPQRQGSSAHSDNYTKGEKSFQETIRQTMERIQTSGEHATAATTSDDPDDVLARMLGQMKNGILDDAGSEEDFSKMLMNMMEQLTNKDILYEPMKELQDKFPAWMDKNRSVTSAKDLKRYEEQQRLAGEIVSRFNDEDYSDSNAADRQYIVERMQLVNQSVLSSCRLQELILSRCKQPAVHLPILLAIWTLHMKHWEILTQDVLSNDTTAAADDATAPMNFAAKSTLYQPR